MEQDRDMKLEHMIGEGKRERDVAAYSGLGKVGRGRSGKEGRGEVGRWGGKKVGREGSGEREVGRGKVGRGEGLHRKG